MKGVFPLTWALFLGASEALVPVRQRPVSRFSRSRRVPQARPCLVASVDAEPPRDKDLETIVGAGGVTASLIVAWSEFTLKTTGCGLPAGPFGSLGAAEGFSYLTIIGVIAWSLQTKVSTGKGLPAGPFGLLGAAEGLSYLVALIGIGVLGFQIADYGYIPEPVPIEGGVCSSISIS